MTKQLEHNQGFSLVELLISMAIGLVILAGVVTVMVDSKDNFLYEEEVAYIQENARFLMDQVGYDIRAAGYVGCPSVLGNYRTNIVIPNPHYSRLGVQGFTSASAGLPPQYSDIQPDTDIVILNYAQPLDGYKSTFVDFGSETITFAEDANAPSNGLGSDGDVVVVSTPNCEFKGLFQQNLAGLTVGYGPDISSDKMFPGPPAITEQANWIISKYESNGYFVRDESPTTGQPALYRVSLVSGGDLEAQEIISGVEDMQVLYGKDNQYRSANDIGVNEADWQEITLVKINFVLRSSRPVFDTDKNVDLGEGFIYNDRFLRQLVSINAKIRNQSIYEILP